MAINQLPDPMLSRKYIKRVVGEPKDLSPPIAKKLENRVHRWMVSIEWLNKTENKDYDTPSRIAASGVAWGDEKDPEEIEAIQKRVKEEKEDIKRKKAKEEVEEKAKGEQGEKESGIQATSKGRTIFFTC